MHLEETPDQLALRTELRAYFAQLLTPEVRHELDTESEGGATFRRIVRQMGSDGWLGIGWPAEYGGQGRPPTDQFIFFTEVQRARAPFPFVTLSTVGPMIINHGTEQQKKFFLSGILAGEINCAIGYTEPEAGTDLASLRTRAVLDGDEWVINGNKIFTSGADQADYIWLACRTDADAPKHKGISIIMVPTATPGFSCTPIVTVGGVATTASYYDDVRVPKDALIGELHGGGRLITGQLNHERVGLAAVSALAFRLWDETDEVLVPKAWIGGSDHRARLRLRLGEGVAGTAAQRRQGMIVNDFRTSPYATKQVLQQTSHTAVLAEPLLYRSRLVGVVTINREQAMGPYTPVLPGSPNGKSAWNTLG